MVAELVRHVERIADEVAVNRVVVVMPDRCDSSAVVGGDSRDAIVGNMTRIASVLRTARRRAGMTQRELAAATGTPQATIGRIEAGSVSPRADTLARLLLATGHELTIGRAIGRGVDRSLIRDRLRMTPAERIGLAVEEARRMPELRIRR